MALLRRAREGAGRHVIDEIDQELESWVGEALPGTPVSFAPPGEEAEGAGVTLQLLELDGLPTARGLGRAPLQVRLGYLVTTGGKDVAKAHKRLGDLLFAAMQHERFEVSFPGRLWEFWQAAGVPPRPGFLLSVPMRRELEEPEVKPVTQRLMLKDAPLRPLDGVVLGPGDVPIADAFVRIASLSLSTRSDRRGRFRFAAVPAGTQTLNVRAKAREFPFTVDLSTTEPVALRLDLAKD